MKINKWTMGLAAVGLVSLASVAKADETTTPLLTALSSTVISGYVDTSVNWSPGTGDANPPPFSFDAGKQDGFNLNVVELMLQKPLDEGQWSAGYTVELLFGPDAVGYNPSANSVTTTDVLDDLDDPTGDTVTTGGLGDFGIKQAYVELRAPVGNGLDFKLGVFDTPIGYESFVGYRNPNYTRSYGYTIEPTQHTGLLASYQFNDMFAFSAGVANTLVSGINLRDDCESCKTYMGAVTFTAPESWGCLAGSALYAGIVNGFGGGDDNQTSLYVGSTIATPIAGLRVGAAFDAAFDSGPGDDYQQAIGLYASFQATEKLSLHGRGEVAKISSISSDQIFELTGTLQYDLWQNVISRLEIRWDHSEDGEFGGSTVGNGSQKNFVQIMANVVYKF